MIDCPFPAVLENRAKIIEWVEDTYPFEVEPSDNSGHGDEIFDWLTENIGNVDAEWTFMDNKVRFKSSDAYALYILTWQRN